MKTISGIVIPHGPPPSVIECLRTFVDGIYGYEETGSWPDNGDLRRWAEQGKEALIQYPESSLRTKICDWIEVHSDHDECGQVCFNDLRKLVDYNKP